MQWILTNLSVVVQSAIFLAGSLIVYGALKNTVGNMKEELAEIKKDQRDLTKTVAQIAVQDARINRLEQDLRDLRHGRGFIVELPPPKH